MNLKFRLICPLLLTAVLSVLLAGCRKDEEAVPVIDVEQELYEIPSDSRLYTVNYKIENGISGVLPEAVSGEDWVTGIQVLDETSLTFSVTENDQTDSREGSIVLSYSGAESAVIRIVQAGSTGDEPQPEEDMSVKVSNVTAFAADITVIPKDKEMTYVILNGLQSDIDALGSDEAVTEYALGVFQEAADYYGYSLEFLLENSSILYHGDYEGKMDVFQPESDYYIYAFGLQTDATVTTSVFKAPFTTSSVTWYDQRIDFVEEEVGIRDISMTVSPESSDFRYLAGYLSEEEFDVIADFVPYMIQETQFVIDMNQGFGIDMTWETVTRDGDSTINASGLFSDCNYVFWAFGAERGYQNTELFTQTVATSSVEVSDDCTFDISITETGTYDVAFSVTPTSDQTRYVVLVTEAEDILGLDDSEVADACINSLNESSPGWATDDNFVFRGQVSESYGDLTPVTSYVLVVFGITTEGERTTAVEMQNFTTQAVPQSDMELSIEVVSSAYSNVTVNIASTSADEEYMYGIMTRDLYESMGGNDEAVLNSIIASHPELSLRSGVGDMPGQILYYDAEYGFIKPGEDYVLFAFGCSYWYPTTRLFTAECSTPAREVSDAQVDIEITVYNGDDFVAYDPVTYPEDKYGNQAVVYIRFLPNQATASWYGWMETRSAEYMEGLNYDILLGAIKDRGTYFDSPAAGTTVGVLPWDYQNVSVLSLGVDADGVDGTPVIRSLCVSRDDAEDFDPSVLGAHAASAQVFYSDLEKTNL